MTLPTEARTSPAAQGRPTQGVAARLLLLLAILAVIGLATAAFAMAYPLPFDSALGFLGIVLLLFPLHLLAVTFTAAVVAMFAWRRHARPAATVFVVAALLGAAMALRPGFAMWQFARQENVPLSLGDYVAEATHLNLGAPYEHRTVTYGTAADGTALNLDLWPAAAIAGGGLRPAIVRIHGGSFTQGNRSDMPDWDRWFNGLGYDVFDVEYRLPPPVRWRDEIGDVKCALGWVFGHAGDYHIDPARISVTGFSAGATLAMLAAYSSGDPRLPPSCDVPPVAVRSVISLYGIPDMPLLYDTSPSRGLVHESSTRYIGGSPAEYPERHAAVSPLTYVGPSSPPTISFLGASDRIVPREQLDILDAALKRAGATSEAYLLPATDHGFDVNWGGFATQFARAKTRQFLQRHP
ncbi:MAG TPA: alpha/beta hydrolase [Stellaceae bacterium]|nr:alpha/beta hydrolase [Stellaceae bacterium]